MRRFDKPLVHQPSTRAERPATRGGVPGTPTSIPALHSPLKGKEVTRAHSLKDAYRGPLARLGQKPLGMLTAHRDDDGTLEQESIDLYNSFDTNYLPTNRIH